MPRDDGSEQVISRCPSCRAGTLDDPTGVTPDVHIFTRSTVGWLELPEAIPAFDVFYDPKTLWPAESRERYRTATGADC